MFSVFFYSSNVKNTKNALKTTGVENVAYEYVTQGIFSIGGP